MTLHQENNMNFHNRTKELDQLEKFYLSEDKEFMVVYGRRRLGKTRLLKEFTKKYSGLFFSCPLCTAKEALRLFQMQMVSSLKEPLLSQTSFPGWPEAFKYAFEQATRNKMIIVLDEFPYLMRSVPGIDSIVQHLWDNTEDAVKLILCGSHVSVMRDHVMGVKAPLYGRRTYTINLGPMSFADISLFYPKVSFEEYVHWYALFGGVPAYAERASKFQNAESALIDMVLSPDGNLYQEPDFLVNEELREPGVYFSVLRSLASGQTKPNQISQDAGVLHSSINKYLDTLRKMHIIEKRIPITEKNPTKSTKGLYFIRDNFLKFWFRYIFPNKTIIELGNGKALFHQMIKKDLNILLGHIYEDICIQKFQTDSQDISGYKAINMGRYWDKNIEIDIIAEDPFEQQVSFIECKWNKNVSIDRTLYRLKRNADLLQHYAGWKKLYFIMSRTGISHPNHIRYDQI